MIDNELREKVIKGLECCATNRLRREDCEAMDCVYLELEGHGCIHQLIRDALVLLKAHEPVKPTILDAVMEVVKRDAVGDGEEENGSEELPEL